MESRRVSPARLLAAALVLLLCAAWTAFAVAYWNGKPPFGGRIMARHVDFILDRLDNFATSTIRIYLSFAPFLFFAFYLTVLLPDVLKRFFPWKGALRAVYWAAAAVLCLFCALGMLNDCSTLLRAASGFPRQLAKTAGAVYPALTPVSLALWVLTWFLPCAGKYLYERLRLRGGLTKPAARAALSCLLCVGVALMEVTISALLMAILKPFAPPAVRHVDSLCTQNAMYPSTCFAAVVLAPLIEETAFRGLIQHHLRRYFPAWAAILITSVCFGVWHRNLGQFVYTFAMGVVMGLIYEYTGKLRYTWFFHFVNNLFSALAYSEGERYTFGKLTVLPAIRKFLTNSHPVVAAVLLAAAAFLLVLAIRMFARLCRADGQPADTP